MMEENTTNPIALSDQEAARNLKAQQFITQDYTFFGEYNYIQIPLDKKILIQEAVENLNAIARPTLKKLENEMNKIEIQDRIYRRLRGYNQAFNTCIMSSKDLRDVNFCSDKFLGFLNNEVRQDAIKILKEY